MAEQVRVGVYARISEDRDGQQTATARQMGDCREFAERRGWEVVDVFEDVDISAFDTKAKRPEFLRMLEALRTGEIDGVVVWKLDRLSRQQRDLVRVTEACEPHKAFLASVVEGINTAESIGQFVAELLVAQARMESANTSIRQRRKAREQKQQGLPPSNGRRCFGYDRKYAMLIEDEAALIREARDRVLAGEGLRSICYDWQSRDIRTTGGNPWRTQFLLRLLLSPTLSAQRELDGQLYPGTWTPIVTPDDTRRLREILSARGGRKRPARVGLVTGHIRCERCGERMYTSRRNDGSRRYTCNKTPGTKACGKMTVLAEPLEELVAEIVFAAVDDASLRSQIEARSGDDDGLLPAIRKDEEALEVLAKDYYADSLVSREEFMAARSVLNERLEVNRAKLAKRTSSGAVGHFLGHGELLREAWAKGSFDWRRSIVGALLVHVEIAPGKPGRLPFDPQRVRPVWKY